jgi:hypothetical protein
MRLLERDVNPVVFWLRSRRVYGEFTVAKPTEDGGTEQEVGCAKFIDLSVADEVSVAGDDNALFFIINFSCQAYRRGKRTQYISLGR